MHRCRISRAYGVIAMLLKSRVRLFRQNIIYHFIRNVLNLKTITHVILVGMLRTSVFSVRQNRLKI